MKIILAPPDGPRQEWDYDLSRITVAELDAIEQVTHLSGLPAFGQAINAGSVRALRALVWVAQKRSDPPLQFDSVDFALVDLSIENEEPPKGDGEQGESLNDATG